MTNLFADYALVPKVPPLDMSRVIRNKEWPADWEAGKALQMQHGSEVVPPECNIEIAAGQYVRMLSARPTTAIEEAVRDLIEAAEQCADDMGEAGTHVCPAAADWLRKAVARINTLLEK